MKTLTKQQAKAIINWYDNEGLNNWGTWGNYPEIGIGASYHSFEDLHCRITLDEVVTIDGEDQFNVIQDGRKQVGKNKGVIIISAIRDYIMTDDEKLERSIGWWKEEYERAIERIQEVNAYNAQSNEAKAEIENLNNQLNAIVGTPNSKGARKEIEQKLSAFHQMPNHLHEGHWMFKAAKFESAEKYIEFKKASSLVSL